MFGLKWRPRTEAGSRSSCRGMVMLRVKLARGTVIVQAGGRNRFASPRVAKVLFRLARPWLAGSSVKHGAKGQNL